MENKAFSLKRLGLMLKYNITYYGRSYLTYFGAVLGLLLTIFLLSTISNNISNDFFSSWYSTIMVLTAILIPGMSFRELRSKTATISYLTIPASTSEKYFASFIITTIGIFTVVSIIFIVFNLLAILIASFFNYHLGFFAFWKWQDFKDIVTSYFLLHSIFFFGASAFKKSQILQTILWLTIIMMAITLLVGGIARLLMQDLFASYNFNILAMDDMGARLKETIKFFGRLVFTISVILLWLATYFKLKEKQVA